MKARVERPHPKMLTNQARKADLIVAQIHKLRAELKWSESQMIESVVRWPLDMWAKVALLAGKDPPSDDVRNAVLATLAKSALVERLVNDTERLTSSERDTRRLELVEP